MALCGFLLGSCGPSVDRPNVVLIIADTLRADALGCYGNSNDPSPELDDLASRGVRFARVIAPSSWTKPSIASILTGMYPRSLGIYKEEDEVLDPSFLTLPEHLRDHGYRTIGVTANPMINAAFNFQQGFDTYINSVDPGAGRVGSASARLAPARAVFDQAFKALARSGSKRPCYLQLDIMEMHEQWRGPASLTRPEYQGTFGDADEASYLEAMRQVSHDVDEFLTQLLAMPGFEDTVVVFVSDHGEGLGSHRHVPLSRYHGVVLYESNVCVPWIVYRHGAELAPRVVERPVRLIDVAPTMVDYLGLPPLEDAAGVSLVPLLTGTGDVALPALFVTETSFRQSRKKGVYGQEFNYYEHLDEQPGLAPRELQVAGSREDGAISDVSGQHPDEVAQYREYLREWEKRFPQRAPTLRPSALPSEVERQLRGIGYFGGSNEKTGGGQPRRPGGR